MSMAASETTSTATSFQKGVVPVLKPEAGFTKIVETQQDFEYRFEFGLSDIESISHQGLDIIILFEDGSALVLEDFVLSNMDLNNVDLADGCVSITDHIDYNVVDLALADMDPAAGDGAPSESATQNLSEELANLEPDAGQARESEDNGGFSFEDPVLTPLQGIGAIGPIGQTSLSYGANFPVPDPFGDLTDELVAGLFGPGPGGDSGPPNGFPGQAGPASNFYDEGNIGDGPVNGQVDFTFGSDGPGDISPNNDVSVDGSVDNGALTSNGSPVTVDATGSGYVGLDANGNTIFTLTIDPLTGEYEFNLLGPLDHADPNNPNDVINLTFGFQIVDANGDVIDTVINIDIADDAPSIGNPAVSGVGEENINASVDGQVDFDFGADDGGHVEFSGEFTTDDSGGQTVLQSDGDPVTITMTPDGFMATDGSGNTIFTLTLNPDTGEYEFNLLGPLDHTDSNNPHDILTLTFGILVIDGDGDSVPGTITINVTDDGPSAFTSFVPVNEVDISDNGVVTFEGQANFDAGADGLGEVNPNGDFQALYQMGGQQQTLTSNGSPITVTMTQNGYQGVDANGNIVFTLSIDPATGEYIYNQYFGIDHASDSDVIWLKFGYQVVDADGDVSNAYIGIDVIDTVPEAEDDHITVTNEDIVDGNVVDNDNLSTDATDHPLTKVSFDGTDYDIAAGQTIQIVGQYGILTISSDGTYSYDPYDGATGVDEFLYTLTDADGDSSEGALDFDVTPPPPAPALVISADEGASKKFAGGFAEKHDDGLDIDNILFLDQDPIFVNDNHKGAEQMSHKQNHNVQELHAEIVMPEDAQQIFQAMDVKVAEANI